MRYGEVLIAQGRTVVLRCSLCDAEYRVYRRFLQHIYAHYDADGAQQFEGTAKLQHSTSEKEEQSYSAEELEIALEEHHFNEIQINSEMYMAKIAPGDEKDHLADPEAIEEAMTIVYPATTDVESSDSSRAPSPLPAPKKKHIKTSKLPQERVHKCETCGMAFKDWSNWRSHTRRHTGLKPYSCQHCGKKFYTSTECATHERRHTGERPFVCSSCGQRFFTSGTLSRHELRHIGHRPCKCNICDKRFFDTTRLREHMVVHTGERNHVCTICNSAFAHLRNLKTHMKLHTNAREYRCNLCDMAFNQLPALSMHKKNKHKIISCSTSKLEDDHVSVAEVK